MQPSKFAGGRNEILLALARLSNSASRDSYKHMWELPHLLIVQEDALGATNNVLAELVSRRHLQDAEDDGKTPDEPDQSQCPFVRPGHQHETKNDRHRTA